MYDRYRCRKHFSGNLFFKWEKKTNLEFNLPIKPIFVVKKMDFYFDQNIKNFETSVNQVFIHGKKYYRKYR